MFRHFLLSLLIDSVDVQMPVRFHTFVFMCFVGGCGVFFVRFPLLANAKQLGSIEIEARLATAVFFDELC